MTRRSSAKQQQPGAVDSAGSISTVVDAFRRILRELRVVARKSELAVGLSPAQVFVLSAVMASPGCSVKEIAEATMTDRSSVASVTDRLAAAGILTRALSGSDRRRASISITPRGKRAMREAAPPPTALLIAALRHLTPEELRGLSDGLVALTRAMGIAHQRAGMLFEEPTSDEATPRRRRGIKKTSR
ncbi:MAG TPA: MarR family winged helix-turn-helix transcriptional regulator [Vicinamibacterales bacterium]|jgi:DNA-binding MarR family transcriptional regulator